MLSIPRTTISTIIQKFKKSEKLTIRKPQNGRKELSDQRTLGTLIGANGTLGGNIHDIIERGLHARLSNVTLRRDLTAQIRTPFVTLLSTDIISPGPFILFWRKKVSFDFAVALHSIDAPDIPKNFAKCSEVKNMVFEPRPFLPWEN